MLTKNCLEKHLVSSHLSIYPSIHPTTCLSRLHSHHAQDSQLEDTDSKENTSMHIIPPSNRQKKCANNPLNRQESRQQMEQASLSRNRKVDRSQVKVF